jgi:ElaB/YqjD/DUF883 family membrane-anchored ribosome-binding protein
MGQDPGTSGTQVNESRDPQEIREDIEVTRQEMGETVEALAAKADVKGQAKQKVEDVKESVSAKKEDLLDKAKQASPETVTSSAQEVSHKVRENPWPLAALGAFAAGFLAGRRSNR